MPAISADVGKWSRTASLSSMALIRAPGTGQMESDIDRRLLDCKSLMVFPIAVFGINRPGSAVERVKVRPFPPVADGKLGITATLSLQR
jgi:hypothetical protein